VAAGGRQGGENIETGKGISGPNGGRYTGAGMQSQSLPLPALAGESPGRRVSSGPRLGLAARDRCWALRRARFSRSASASRARRDDLFSGGGFLSWLKMRPLTRATAAALF